MFTFRTVAYASLPWLPNSQNVLTDTIKAIFTFLLGILCNHINGN